ncbi:hypothetical protein D3C84_535530 [compost metagenome]
MLSGQHHLIGLQKLFECLVTCFAGLLLEACAWLDLHLNNLQWHVQGGTEVTTMGGPGISDGLEAVMDVDGAQGRQGVLLGQVDQQVKQDGGVEAAGEGDVPGRGVAPRGQVVQEGLHGYGTVASALRSIAGEPAPTRYAYGM